MPKPFALKEPDNRFKGRAGKTSHMEHAEAVRTERATTVQLSALSAVPMAPVNTENHDRLPEYTICLSSFLLVFEKCMKKYLKRLEDII